MLKPSLCLLLQQRACRQGTNPKVHAPLTHSQMCPKELLQCQSPL
jgi:hypothetical protein